MAPQRYSKAQLNAIGEQASNRLPPASAMQGMFLYEMQRGAENERLFHNQLFQLARAEQDIADQEYTTESLSEQVKILTEKVETLESQLKRKDVHDRVATSQVRLDVFQAKLKQLDQQLDEQSKRLAIMERNSEDSNAEIDSLQKAIMNTAHAQDKMINDDTTHELSEMNQDITVLFEERDALAKILHDTKARIDEVEQQSHQSVERIEATNKKLDAEIKKLENKTNKRISTVEKRIPENGTSAAKNGESAASGSQWLVDDLRETEAQLEELYQQTSKQSSWSELHARKLSTLERRFDGLDLQIKRHMKDIEHEIGLQASTVEAQVGKLSNLAQGSAEHDFQVNMQIRELKQKDAERSNKAEKDLEERISKAEQQMTHHLGKIKQEASDEVAKAKQNIIDRVTKSQKSRSQHIVELNNEIKAQVANVETKIAEELKKINSQASKLQLEFDTKTKEQQERIAKLEDLVRALTAQSPSSASISSQHLSVKTANGASLNLSVPKGHSFVPQKENIRTFTPGKQWMT